MKIYTRSGDTGQTSLIGGFRVPKDNDRVDAYGTVDELNCWIGLLRDLQIDPGESGFLTRIQDRLFVIGSHLASDPLKSVMKLPELVLTDISDLENAIDVMDLKLPALKSFVLPGGHTAVSYCHITRAVCRRAERGVVSLPVITSDSSGPLLVVYLNRLSDYLFTLARYWSMLVEAPEIPWLPDTQK